MGLTLWRGSPEYREFQCLGDALQVDDATRAFAARHPGLIERVRYKLRQDYVPHINNPDKHSEESTEENATEPTQHWLDLASLRLAPTQLPHTADENYATEIQLERARRFLRRE